ncbi:Rrf2 family transcriptional regulator [candidate division KSB1 bacterium]|nr:MAG: Rrf2 family transcriptional regulator [candidate division KSB1 bacterium]
MLSATWQYSIRALVHLAMARGKGPVLASHIAETEGIPLPFLSKILHQLKVAGIVAATRGQKGGYIMQRDPAKLTLLDVAHLTDHVDFGEQCLLGYKFCDENCNCVLHREWEGIKKEIKHFLETRTIEHLATDSARAELDIDGMLRFRQPPLHPPYEVTAAELV